MESGSSKAQRIRERSLEEVIFNHLLKYASKMGYNYDNFYKICSTEHKKDTNCPAVWLQLINLAEKLMLLQKKRPAAAVIWFIDTAFPLASILMSEKYRSKSQQLTPYALSQVMRMTGNQARLDEEAKRARLYSDLLEEERRFYQTP